MQLCPEGKKSARQRLIIAELALTPAVRTSELAKRLNVSAETVRRDIEELTRRGLVSRTYGGAAANQAGQQPEFAARSSQAIEERDAIAQSAVLFVKPGDVLMIDSGSTIARFAQALAGVIKRNTIITNCFAVANAFPAREGIKVIVCPGDFSAVEKGVYGLETVSFLKKFNADIAFIGASGLTAEGLSDVESQACWVKRAMLAQARHTVLLLDSGKFNRRFLEQVCTLSAISDLVTDRLPGGELLDALNVGNVNVHVAAKPSGR